MKKISAAAAELGRKGGKSTSEAKQSAARENGKLGGRPTWNYKVVKFQRGMKGQWFAHPTAATFSTKEEACKYAQDFAEEQRGVGGTRINVISRKKFLGDFGLTNNVAEYRVKSLSEK